MINLIDVLQYLKPDIKVAVYKGLPMQKTHYFDAIEKINKISEEVMEGFEYDVEIDGEYISYNESETFRPTKEEILAVDREAAEVIILERREADRKTLRDEEGKKNLSLVASFSTYKLSNPAATFSQYLDIIEGFSEEL